MCVLVRTCGLVDLFRTTILITIPRLIRVHDMSAKRGEQLVSGNVAREPWLELVRSRAQRPASARHVARPKVAAAAARPASARSASASRRAGQTMGGGVCAHPQRWATGTQARRQPRPQAPATKKAAHADHNGNTQAYIVHERDLGKTTYSVREKRLRCSVVAGRQPFTPRPAVQRPASARVTHAAPLASADTIKRSEDASQSGKPAGTASAAPAAPRREAAAVPRSKGDVQDLREMLGVPDGIWAFAPNEKAGYGGGEAISAAGRRRLLMPTWERLARRVELMQQQNEEASELLTGLASTAAAPVTQRPTRTSGIEMGGTSVLPDSEWPQEGPLGSTTPKIITTGWRGRPESSRRLRSNPAKNEVADQVSYGRAGKPIEPQNKVKIKLEPGRDWSELLW